MHNEIWVYTEILPLTVLYTGARALSPLSRVRCPILERNADRALNLGITGAFWDTFGSLRSSVACESGFHLIVCKYLTIAPIVRKEPEAILGCVPLGGSGSGFLILDHSDHRASKERSFSA